MTITITNRGFQKLEHPVYGADQCKGQDPTLVAQSSTIGDYEDSFDRPGSSYLWFGQYHHLDRDEVKTLVKHLKCWLKTGDLKSRKEPNEEG